jgi:hypothetical protein
MSARPDDEHPVDAVMQSLGLSLASTGRHSRRYEGEVDSRRVQVHYQRLYNHQSKPPAYLRSTLQVIVDAPDLKTRFQVGPAKRALSRMKSIPLDDPAYDDLHIMGLDAGWSRQLATGSSTRPLILRLSESPSASGTSTAIQIQPGAAMLTTSLHEAEVTEDLAGRLIGDMVAFAAAAGTLPATPQPVEATSSERALAEGRRGLLGAAGLVLIVGVLILIAGACLLALFVLPNLLR